ncbi:class II aldolase/adducin family protein [Escherichia coli]
MGVNQRSDPHFQTSSSLPFHCERIKATNGKDRVIMHCHATNLIALTYVLENDTAVFTRQLWEGSAECLVVSRMALAFCRGWCRARTKSARQLHEMQKHSLVLWPFHGVLAAGRRWMKHSVNRHRRKISTSISEGLFDRRHETDHQP